MRVASHEMFPEEFNLQKSTISATLFCYCPLAIILLYFQERLVDERSLAMDYADRFNKVLLSNNELSLATNNNIIITVDNDFLDAWNWHPKTSTASLDISEIRDKLEILGRNFNQFVFRYADPKYGSSLGITDKKDHNPVTDIDKGLEDLISCWIKTRFPSHKIIGEEQPELYGERDSINGDDYVWYIDPVDGTENFINAVNQGINSNTYVGINISLYHGGIPLVAYLGIPLLEYYYIGSAGTKNVLSVSQGEVTAIPSIATVKEVSVGTEDSLYVPGGDYSFFREELCVKDAYILKCSSINLAGIIENKINLFYKKRVKLWDIMTALALIRFVDPDRRFRAKIAIDHNEIYDFPEKFFSSKKCVALVNQGNRQSGETGFFIIYDKYNYDDKQIRKIIELYR
ncbi:MAG TPA: hypothetical protein DF296_06990 [Candidatus Margulisbacteria bacterium]|nr:hypothetical protein [Candidatus Margulisiibacteriota bacterium]